MKRYFVIFGLLALAFCSCSDDDEQVKSYQVGLRYITLRVADNLDLPVKWSALNLGADYPEEYGLKVVCDDSLSRENIDSMIYSQFGEGWRLPTTQELHEFADRCRWKSMNLHGVDGSLVSRYENLIFVPAVINDSTRIRIADIYLTSDATPSDHTYLVRPVCNYVYPPSYLRDIFVAAVLLATLLLFLACFFEDPPGWFLVFVGVFFVATILYWFVLGNIYPDIVPNIQPGIY